MIKTLAKSIREYKWAALLSPLCMVGEVFMETRIPRVLSRIVDLGVTLGDMGAVIRYGLLPVLRRGFCLLCLLRRYRFCQESAPRYVLPGADL